MKKGDEVVVSIMEHHSDLCRGKWFAGRRVRSLNSLNVKKDGSLDLNKAEELITDRTKIVAVTQLSNVLGREYPIEKLAEIAHRKNAVMVADGAQSTPHIAVDVKKAWGGFLCVFRSQALWTYEHRRALRQA